MSGCRHSDTAHETAQGDMARPLVSNGCRSIAIGKFHREEPPVAAAASVTAATDARERLQGLVALFEVSLKHRCQSLARGPNSACSVIIFGP